MAIQRIRLIEELNGLRVRWNELAGQNPFRRWEWTRSWWEQFSGCAELYVLQVTDSFNRLVGIAPLIRETSLFSGRKLRLLGTGRACSEYLGLLCDEQDGPFVAHSLAAWLTDAGRRGKSAFHEDDWDLMELEPVAADDKATILLAESLQARGNAVRQLDGCHCWRIPLPTSWQEYLDSRPKRYRRKIRKVNELLTDNPAVQLTLASTPKECVDSLEQLISLHERRRRSQSERGCFSSREFRRFFHGMATEFFRGDRLFLLRLDINRETVGCNVGILGDTAIHLYQCGIHPGSLSWQPGWMMNAFTVKHAIESGYSGIDFLRGDEIYKSHLGATPVHNVAFKIASQRLGSRLRNELGRGPDFLRDTAKRIIKGRSAVVDDCPSCGKK